MIPLDAHAHVPLSVSARDLGNYAPSLVLAVTGSPAHWATSLRRRDASVAWGIGCHPGDDAAVGAFDERAFARAAAQAPFIGEVGLDARSRASSEAQEAVFAAVLRIAEAEGLTVSAHSAGRSSDGSTLRRLHREDVSATDAVQRSGRRIAGVTDERGPAPDL